MSIPAKRIEHPYITRREEVCGGDPIIRGTRTPVRSIVGYYRNVGYSPEEIVHHLPHLTLAQVHDALSYYYDHQEEIDEEIRLNENEVYWKQHAEEAERKVEAQQNAS